MTTRRDVETVACGVALDEQVRGRLVVGLVWDAYAGHPHAFAVWRTGCDPDGVRDLFHVVKVSSRRWRREWEHEDCETPDDVGAWSEPYTGRGWRERLAADVAAYAIAAVGGAR